MIPRYTRPEMGAVWSDQNKFQQWLEVELAASETLAELGVPCPPPMPQFCGSTPASMSPVSMKSRRRHGTTSSCSPPPWRNRWRRPGHPEASRWFHYGLTSTDVVDTAQALQIRQAANILRADLEKLRVVLKRRALEFKHTVQIGRTHGVHAEPVTFGMKLALWYGEAGRDLKRLDAAVEDYAAFRQDVGSGGNIRAYRPGGGSGDLRAPGSGTGAGGYASGAARQARPFCCGAGDDGRALRKDRAGSSPLATDWKCGKPKSFLRAGKRAPRRCPTSGIQ